MRLLIVTAFMFFWIGFNACSTHVDRNYYDRANKASENSLDGLEKEY